MAEYTDTMKYFTLAWWEANQDLKNPRSGEISRPIEDYKNYYASIKSNLPSRLVEFYDSHSFHDAVLLNLNLNIQRQELWIELLVTVFADKRRDEKPIRVQYLEMTSFASSAGLSNYCVAGPGGYGDLGYTEIEVLNADSFEHRMLFSSGIEITIQFKGFDFHS